MGEWSQSAQHEQLRSFDELASIDMMAFDLRAYGYVKPETRQQILNEELSYLAEGVDRASRTSFSFDRDEDGGLLYFKDGRWSSYMGMLLTGYEAAKQDAQRDSRRSFLVDWAANDLMIGYKLKAMQPGDRLSWTNSYPHDEARRLGADFLKKECGLQPERKMGFIYQAVCHRDGRVELLSQTVDQSDAEAFEAVERAQKIDPQLDIDGLTRAYDGVLRQRYGDYFFAGRRLSEQQENAWQIILSQTDLITYFMEKIEQLAHGSLNREQLRRQARRNLYGTWALFKRRIDGEKITYPMAQSMDTGPIGEYHMMSTRYRLEQDIQESYQQFAARGEVLAGCGGGVSAETDASSEAGAEMGADAAFAQIFGTQSRPEKYSFDKYMFCGVCQAPPKKNESKQLCGPCGICKSCDKITQIKKTGKVSFALAA